MAKKKTSSRARGVRRAPARESSTPRLVKGLRITPSTNGYIVYDAGRERVHYLNHTAALVMDLCTGRNSLAEIVTLVGAAYGLPRKPAREVGALVRQLAGEGLIALDS